jgi:hypothetical protein
MVRAFQNESVAIRVEPPNPRIREDARVYFSTGGGPATAIIRSREGTDTISIHDGEALRLRIPDDHPIEIRLVDEKGTTLARKLIKPVVSIPCLEFLNLKSEIPYDRVLTVKGAASNVNRVTLRWRVVGSKTWTPQYGHRNGSFSFDIHPPKLATRLEIELVLKSRDADVAPSARVVKKKKVMLIHPEPEVVFSQDTDSVRCQARCTCNVSCRWIAKATLEYEGPPQALLVDSKHEAVTQVQINTARAGQHVLHLRVVGLNGRTRDVIHTVRVTPRVHDVQVATLDDGTIEFWAVACSNLRLRIPANQSMTEIHTLHGRIGHAFLKPTEAFLTYDDDDGVVHRKRLVLQRTVPNRWES